MFQHRFSLNEHSKIYLRVYVLKNIYEKCSTCTSINIFEYESLNGNFEIEMDSLISSQK